MADPVAALGLAANIVQFVDFSHKLLSESRALYNSATGSSADNTVIEAVATDLDLLNAKLTAPSAAGAIPESMRSLASQCKDVASELLAVLDKIKVKGPHRKWKSFVQALQSVWRKEEIDELVRRMERLRDEMHFRLQIMMRCVVPSLNITSSNLHIVGNSPKSDPYWPVSSMRTGDWI